jgi:AcrR family transcriptional regulator
MKNQGHLSKPLSRHRKKQKAETRDLILSSARNLFERLGFERTTMRAVASEAEMGYGTIFKHFSNKSDLLAACLHEEIEKTLIEAFNSLPAEKTLQEQFLYIAGKLIRHYAERPNLSKTFIENIFMVGGAWKNIMDHQIEQFLLKLQEIVQNAKIRGEIRQDIDNGLLSLSLFSSYISVLVLSLRAETFDPDETIRKLEILIDLNLKGALTEQRQISR